MRKKLLTLLVSSFSMITSYGQVSCDESTTIDDVIELGPEGYEQWTEKSGLLDGTYYEATVVFSDDTRGKLFQGGGSGKYFIEDSTGYNYYYVSLRAAVRALYLYKKCGLISTKYRS